MRSVKEYSTTSDLETIGVFAYFTHGNFNEVVPKSDTIVVKVTAKGENDKELVSTVKCSASNMRGSY